MIATPSSCSRRRMTTIPIQVYGINLLVRLMAEGPADVRVHCPKGSPIRYGDAVAAHVERWLAKEGFELEIQTVAPGRPNVVAWHGDPGGPALLLEGHTDVVTEGDPALWHHPPFEAEFEDGRIYGRGAADMKSGLAAAMVAAAAVKRSDAPLRGRLLVGALVDEEGDMIGARHLCGTPIGKSI